MTETGTRSALLTTIRVGGTTAAWEAVGFATDDAGRMPFANGALAFSGVEGEPGLLGIAVTGLDDVPADLEGIPLSSGDPVPMIEHPNGSYELDHLVIVTDSLERTSAAVAEVLGHPQRRLREEGDVRQAFHRMGPGGVIVEIVERADAERVELFGVVFNTTDLDGVVARYGRDVIGEAKEATQPGRRIATFRSGAGLGVPTALMTPDV